MEAKLIAYAWIVTVLVVIAVAVAKRQPILHAFAPLPVWWLSSAALATAVLLLVFQLRTEAMIVLLAYAWICIAWRARE